MELPHIGQHCAKINCNKLDFLPAKCDACLEIFCNEHYFYPNHNCQNAYRKDNQVPVCPLCNIPIPVGQGQEPDRIVGAHIDNDCRSDPAKTRRKIFTNKCSLAGCKLKEFVPLVCKECTLNFCLKHRHPHDHECIGQENAKRKNASDAALARQKQQMMSTNGLNSYENKIHGNLSEDEALARALALSMLQQSESQTAVGESSGMKGKCNLS